MARGPVEPTIETLVERFRNYQKDKTLGRDTAILGLKATGLAPDQDGTHSIRQKEAIRNILQSSLPGRLLEGAKRLLREIIGNSDRAEVRVVGSEEDVEDPDEVDSDMEMTIGSHRKRTDTPRGGGADSQVQKRSKKTRGEAEDAHSGVEVHGPSDRGRSPVRKATSNSGKDSPARKPMGKGSLGPHNRAEMVEATATPGALQTPAQEPAGNPEVKKGVDGEPSSTGSSTTGQEMQHEVERIICHYMQAGEQTYWVKWKGFPEEKNSQLSESSAEACGLHEMIADYHNEYDARTAKEARKAAGKTTTSERQDEDWEPKGTPKAKAGRRRGTPGSAKQKPKGSQPDAGLMTSHFGKSPVGRSARKREQATLEPGDTVTARIAHVSGKEENRRKRAKVTTDADNEDQGSGLPASSPPGGPQVRKDSDRSGAPGDTHGVGQAAGRCKTSSAGLDVVT
jgi:hypothetical protein